MGFLRKFFFYFFFLIFIIFCPLIVLYALGYLFKPGHEQGIVKTGVIYTATVPPGAKVTLAGKPLDKETPDLLLDLMPGDYQLELSLEGYRPWSQKLPVEAGKATVLDKILLVPEAYKTEVLAEGDFRDLVSINKGNQILLTQSDRLSEVRVADIRNNTDMPLLTQASALYGRKFLRFFTSSASGYVIFEVDNGTSKPQYLRFKAGEEGGEVLDITPLFLKKPEKIYWNSSSENTLYTFTQGIVDRLDLREGIAASGFLQNVRGMGLFEKGVYALMQDNTLLLRDEGGDDKKPLSRDKELVRTLLGEQIPYELNVFARDLVLFRGPEGQLVSNRLPYVHAEFGINGLEFYGGLFQPLGPRKVLAWSEREIGILDFRRLPPDKEIFEKGIRLAWVYREGADIRQAFWVYEATHILFLDGDQVMLLEMEGFGQSIVSPVVRVKRGSVIHYSEETGRVYFLEPKHAALSSIEILPKRKIQFQFPEFKEERKESGIREV